MKIKISEFKKIIKQELVDDDNVSRNIEHIVKKYRGTKLKEDPDFQYEFPNNELASKAVWAINRARSNQHAERKENIVTLYK
jgi:hypothetical protein